MRQRYWLKIALGALAVFAVGMVLIVLARASIGEVKALARSSRPIGIPLAAILPFRVDGRQLGNVRRVELLRTSPHEISGFRLIVRLRDSTGTTHLGDCTLTMNDPDSFATRGGFGCEVGDSGSGHLKRIGEVVFEPGGAVRAIFAPADHAAPWRGHDFAALQAEVARLQADGLADSAARVRIEADSARALIEVGGDSAGALLRIQADSHGARMQFRDRSGRDVFRLRADPTGASVSVLGDSAAQKR
jgi:hypothetical protein